MSRPYFPARTFSFYKLSGALMFDVFVRLSERKYTKILAAGDILELERLSAYILKGTEHFYIPTEQKRAFVGASTNILDSITKTSGVWDHQAEQVLDEVTENVLTDIFSNNVLNEGSAKTLSSVVSSYVDLAKRQPAVFPSLLKLARQRESLLRHQVTTSVFATLIARAIDPINLDLIYTTGYSAMIHDIGISFLNLDIDEHSLQLDQNSVRKIRVHPAMGSDLLKKIDGMPPLIPATVLQHHEGFDGSGYPMGLKGEDIVLPARILHVADAFAARITGSPQTIALAPAMALHSLTLDASHDPAVVRALAKLLNLA